MISRTGSEDDGLGSFSSSWLVSSSCLSTSRRMSGSLYGNRHKRESCGATTESKRRKHVHLRDSICEHIRETAAEFVGAKSASLIGTEGVPWDSREELVFEMASLLPRDPCSDGVDVGLLHAEPAVLQRHAPAPDVLQPAFLVSGSDAIRFRQNTW